MSLRRLSELAGISNPYLSQIERGLRRPSAEILQQIAKALRISAETLYVQAGILEPPDGTPDLTRAILADQAISEDQKQALVRIYLSFRREFEEEQAQAAAARAHDEGQGSEPTAPEQSAPDPADPGSFRRTGPDRHACRDRLGVHRHPSPDVVPGPGPLLGVRTAAPVRDSGSPVGSPTPCAASPSCLCTRPRWPSQARATEVA